jgi:steroid delta-isomerase-like uncharacterized protein
MSSSQTQVLDQFLAAYNRGEWDQLDELVCSDYVHRNGDQALTLADFKRGALWIRAGLPDFHIAIEDMVCEGDRVAVRFVGHGTHLGSLAGEEPMGRTVVLHGMVIYRFRDGRIAEDWEAMDEQQLLRQTGLA